MRDLGWELLSDCRVSVIYPNECFQLFFLELWTYICCTEQHPPFVYRTEQTLKRRMGRCTNEHTCRCPTHNGYTLVSSRKSVQAFVAAGTPKCFSATLRLPYCRLHNGNVSVSRSKRWRAALLTLRVRDSSDRQYFVLSIVELFQLAFARLFLGSLSLPSFLRILCGLR